MTTVPRLRLSIEGEEYEPEYPHLDPYNRLRDADVALLEQQADCELIPRTPLFSSAPGFRLSVHRGEKRLTVHVFTLKPTGATLSWFALEEGLRDACMLYGLCRPFNVVFDATKVETTDRVAWCHLLSVFKSLTRPVGLAPAPQRVFADKADKPTFKTMILQVKSELKEKAGYLKMLVGVRCAKYRLHTSSISVEAAPVIPRLRPPSPAAAVPVRAMRAGTALRG